MERRMEKMEKDVGDEEFSLEVNLVYIYRTPQAVQKRTRIPRYSRQIIAHII